MKFFIGLKSDIFSFDSQIYCFLLRVKNLPLVLQGLKIVLLKSVNASFENTLRCPEIFLFTTWRTYNYIQLFVHLSIWKGKELYHFYHDYLQIIHSCIGFKIFYTCKIVFTMDWTELLLWCSNFWHHVCYKTSKIYVNLLSNIKLQVI